MNKKTCTKCGEIKFLNEFHRNGIRRRADCKTCNTQRVKDRKKDKRKYLIDKYESMKQRVNGTHSSERHKHIYVGLELMDRDEFIRNSLNDIEYNRLHDEWSDSGYDHKLAPSTDRLDGDIGYVWDNIDWTTHSINSRNGNASRYGLI